eukprot:1981717-Heterocapsa_arctica.AAC.1
MRILASRSVRTGGLCCRQPRATRSDRQESTRLSFASGHAHSACPASLPCGPTKIHQLFDMGCFHLAGQRG